MFLLAINFHGTGTLALLKLFKVWTMNYNRFHLAFVFNRKCSFQGHSPFTHDPLLKLGFAFNTLRVITLCFFLFSPKLNRVLRDSKLAISTYYLSNGTQTKLKFETKRPT